MLETIIGIGYLLVAGCSYLYVIYHKEEIDKLSALVKRQK